MSGYQQHLDYVKAAHAGSTVPNFTEDFEPIGATILQDLQILGYIEIDKDKRIVLTALGEAARHSHVG